MNNRFELRQSSVKKQGVFNNVTNMMGRSFISTHLAQQSYAMGDDLRKSRITNLPNYKKTNLGQTPNFIIVFQTIEIERLSSQIELLRVKLKEAQRQLFNAQNYEVQIRQLTEKCFSYENQLGEYRQEIQKLNKICETLYHENQTLKVKLNDMDFSLKQKYESQKQKNQELQQQTQKWKARYQASQKSKAKQLQDLRNLMQCQRKSMIDRQIRQMAIRFQNQRSGLQNQIRKNRQMLNNKNYQVDQLKQKCQKYEISLMEMRNYQGHMHELQTKVSLLSQQLVRLNQVLRDRQDTIQSHKKIEYELNLKLKQQTQWQHQCQQLKNLVESKNKEMQEWKIRSARFQDQSIRGKQLIHFNNQLSDKLELAVKEVDRLNNAVRHKIDQIDKWKIKLQQKQMQISKLKNIQNQIPQYHSKINMLNAQLERTNGIQKSRLGQIQNWKKKANQLQNTITKFALIQKDKQSIQERFNKQIKNHEQLKFAYSKLQNDLNNYKKYEAKCREIENTNNGLTREKDRLNNNIRNLSTQLNDYRQRFKQIQVTLDQYKNIQNQLKDYQNKIILLAQQIQRLNQLIKNKNQDIDQLEAQKLQVHSKMSHYKNYEIKMNQNEQIVSKMQNNIQIQKRDIQNWQNKFRSSDAKIRQLQNNLFQANSEKDKVSSGLRNKLNDFQDLRNRYQNLQSEMRQVGQLKQMCQQQHNQIVLYLKDLETMDRKSKQCERQLNNQRSRNKQQKSKNQQLTKKVTSITTEIQRLSRQLSGNTAKKAKQFDQLQAQFSKLVTRSRSKDEEIQILIAKSSQLETQVRKLMQQFCRLLKQAEKSQAQTKTLYQRIQQYQDYAKRISILDAQMNRLQGLNRGLEQDNKKMRLKYSSQIQIQKRQEQFNLLTVLMAAQIQSLRLRLEQRELSIEEMRKSILEPVRRI